MKNLLALLIITSLVGCVVTPAYRVQPVVAPVPTTVEIQQVPYPQNESAYIWDPVTVTFFFVYGDHRYYMDRGWHPIYGYPRGHYRRR